MLGEDGQKMSKSKRNYREPHEIFDRYGADALRWYFFANQPPWTSIRYSEQAIKESIPEFLLRLWNVYSFFVIYANIDGFDPAATLAGDVGPARRPTMLAGGQGYRPVAERSELDRWILSELHRDRAAVVERMDAYDNFAACRRLTEFVDALSNWYVRRSRDRFWSGDKQSADKLDAYWTLYECLLTTCKLIAPFVPFLAEAIWQNLAVAAFGGEVPESVHLCDYPAGRRGAGRSTTSSRRMALVREIVSLGRAARAAEKLKVRQPLSQGRGDPGRPGRRRGLAGGARRSRLRRAQRQAVRDLPRARPVHQLHVLPDLKRLGPRLGKDLPRLQQALAAADAAAILAAIHDAGQATLPLAGGGEVMLEEGDVIVRTTAKPGWAAAEGPRAVVVVANELTPDLVAEGLVREVVHAVQTRRKTLDLEFTDRIELAFATPSAELRAALEPISTTWPPRRSPCRPPSRRGLRRRRRVARDRRPPARDPGDAVRSAVNIGRKSAEPLANSGTLAVSDCRPSPSP